VTRARSGDRLRLDEAVVTRGLVETRSKARAVILAGDVTVNGITNTRAGSPVRDADVVALRAKPRFVSRGGEKLAHALETFGLPVESRICADLGASTGGFTDCLLQAGATRVYAVDVGYGQLDSRLRDDPRVVVLERTNARYLESLPELVSLVTIDVSFISLELILPVARRLLVPDGWCLSLIKPQFEAGRGEVGDRGVVRDPETHRKVLRKVLGSARDNGFTVECLTASPLRGPEGNVEFLALLRFAGTTTAESPDPGIEAMIETAMGET
jgi:23S rRNA (cytidine1920-2'-O)/16S rRNA (cytidine1409-2'-O)-methyltransferase